MDHPGPLAKPVTRGDGRAHGPQFRAGPSDIGHPQAEVIVAGPLHLRRHTKGRHELDRPPFGPTEKDVAHAGRPEGRDVARPIGREAGMILRPARQPVGRRAIGVGDPNGQVVEGKVKQVARLRAR